ncbi:MAG TPA: hypothetical protein PLC89_16655 [Haliscomenobacter sp.]|uniref:hypothetical protein n=1 Tax=Haliscomenobacter sp. TaxID=2717303 RepID=UPI002C1E653D|nr:hypothetical protein [Haliscomenobacter sp.]HOY18937.1 hypothetical protein [Haliscomenobacter sp.]
MRHRSKLWTLAAFLLAFTGTLSAQEYFGRNKPSYESFNFDVYRSPNFEIYSYLKNADRRKDLADFAELWYRYHQNLLTDTFATTNPLIFYNDHADFQQTNTISGGVGVGTGGVTEAFKNRVIMPIALTNQATYQVLGHELVHAFQFNRILNGDSTSIQNLGNLPLWVVEGMAEYMSTGSVDPHTAMWMRDAVLNDDVPTLDQLNNPKYFPYRYGHAFWSFLTGLKTDMVIEPFFKAVAIYGVDAAVPMVLGMSKKDFSKLWQDAITAQFKPSIAGKEKNTYGKPILDDKDGGQMNISPSISPDGKYVLFTSERNLFSTDIFLADATNGQIMKTVASTARGGNVDFFDFLESSGAWSPDSKRVAVVGFKRGRNVLLIKSPFTGKTLDELAPADLQAFSNPTWSPDGKTIVVAGLKEGHTDLYAYNIRTRTLKQLTDDKYSEIQPTWSEDGQTLFFSTDQKAWENGRTYGRLTFNLASIDIVSGQLTHYDDVFPGADNLNPQLDTAGNIIFMSNRDGYRNLYRYNLDTKELTQLTDLAVGISGISHYSPAISVDRKRDRVLYTLYGKRGYSIYRATSKDFLDKKVDPNDVTYAAAQLPRLNRAIKSIVDQQIAVIDEEIIGETAPLTAEPYKSKFKLDFLTGGGGLGVGNNLFGTNAGLAGGVQALFSDILGNNQIIANVALNGQIQDLGGMVTYINRKGKFQWGGSLMHIPYPYYSYDSSYLENNNQVGTVVVDQFNVYRIFQSGATGFVQYPFSSTLRAEAEIDFTRISQSLRRIKEYSRYDPFYYGGRGQSLGQDQEKVGDLPGFSMPGVGAAIVGDKSNFGLTAPLQGYRFRAGFRQYLGDVQFLNPTLDFRGYLRKKPFTFAARVMHTGRYGRDSENTEIFPPLYLGTPWWVRGFQGNIAQNLERDGLVTLDNLIGTKIGVFNAEVRIPLLGPKQLALIKSNIVPADLNFFFDTGVIWTRFEQFNFEGPNGKSLIRPLSSVGASVRVNLFGALILEPYYAIPLLKGAKGGFGLNFMPGW